MNIPEFKKLNTKKIFENFWPLGGVFLSIFFTKLAAISQLHCPNAFNIARIVALVLTNILIPNITWAGLGVTCCIPLKSAESSKNRQFWRKFSTFFSKSSVIVLKDWKWPFRTHWWFCMTHKGHSGLISSLNERKKRKFWKQFWALDGAKSKFW